MTDEQTNEQTEGTQTGQPHEVATPQEQGAESPEDTPDDNNQQQDEQGQ